MMNKKNEKNRKEKLAFNGWWENNNKKEVEKNVPRIRGNEWREGTRATKYKKGSLHKCLLSEKEFKHLKK